MKKLILLSLLLVAFITFSFRIIKSNKITVKNKTSNEQTQVGGGFASADPIQ